MNANTLNQRFVNYSQLWAPASDCGERLTDLDAAASSRVFAREERPETISARATDAFRNTFVILREKLLFSLFHYFILFISSLIIYFAW